MADTKTVDLGSVGIVNGHTYSETTTYNSNTFVKYKESTWLCIKDGTVGIEPNYTNASNWQAMAIGIDQYTTESRKAAKEAKSYAIGDTSTRDGEDTDNAKYYSEQAKASEEKAATSETNAKTSETNAKDSEDNSSASEINADMYKKDAATSAANAKASENAAKASETKAKDSETAAKSSETNAKASEVSAIDAANRVNKIANGLTGALKPMGTITHDKLPALSDAITGDMYNISDGYTSDDNYEDGSGVFIPAGSNVYKTANGKWDVLAGTSINGVKGAAETEYHTNGNIDLGPSAIGSPSVEDMNNAVAKLNGLIDAKLNKDNVSNAKNVTASGYAADARAIKEIWDTINIILSVPEDPFNVTIPSNAWTSSAPYTNSVSVTGKGITSEKSYEILGFVPTGTLATDIAQKEALGCITYGTNDTDSMIFIALEEKPSANVTVTMRRCK